MLRSPDENIPGSFHLVGKTIGAMRGNNKGLEKIRHQDLQNLEFVPNILKSRYSSVGIALGYGLDDRGSKVRFPAGAVNFSLHHRVQNGSGAHPASYPLGTSGSFPEGKAAGA
jgi:hypothetical protein